MPEQPGPGVVVVRYAASAELAAERQAAVVARLVREARHGPTAIVFVVGPAVHAVDLSVPRFWLDATRDRGLRLAALAVVSEHPSVRLATAGFGAANVVRGARFSVRAFEGERAALGWAEHALELARAAEARVAP